MPFSIVTQVDIADPLRGPGKEGRTLRWAGPDGPDGADEIAPSYVFFACDELSSYDTGR